MWALSISAMPGLPGALPRMAERRTGRWAEARPAPRTVRVRRENCMVEVVMMRVGFSGLKWNAKKQMAVVKRANVKRKSGLLGMVQCD